MIDNKLTYQQAKRLRGQSLSSVFADQLIMGEGYGSGIAKTISLKTRAKITGIKQKFDPLNIAKFLTGGSRLGPAILGKMLGRSRKDIEFFTGRARPVTSRNKQIGALPSGEDTTGMSAILNDVLTFLQKSHEDDMILREKENNLREGQMHEEEKRHKELLKALGVKGGKKGTATPAAASEKEGGGLLSTLQNMLNAAIQSMMSIINGLMDKVKAMITAAFTGYEWLKNAGMLRWLAGFATPLAFIAAIIGAQQLTEYIGKKQQDDANELLKRISNRENLSEEEKLKLDNDIKSFGGEKKLTQVADDIADKPLDERPVPAKPDTSGGKNKARADSWEKKYGETHNENGTPKKLLGYVSDAEQIATMNKANSDTSFNDAETKKLQRQAPQAVIPPPASAQVTTRTNENRQVEMDERLNRLTKSTEQTRTASGKLLKPDGKPRFKPPIIAVRNVEPTFRNVIYNSTRIV